MARRAAHACVQARDFKGGSARVASNPMGARVYAPDIAGNLYVWVTS